MGRGLVPALRFSSGAPGRPQDKWQQSAGWHGSPMGSRTSEDEEGRRRSTELRRRIGADIRQARRAAGLSQRAVSAKAGMSRSQFARIERGENASLSFEQASRAAEAVGLHLGAHLFPGDDPARDAPQLRLLERFRSQVPAGARWRTEVPLRIPGDRRAWDATVELLGRRAGCEAETKAPDVQALERKLALKLRDGEVDVLILVLADTAANREMLRHHREDLRGLLPLDTRGILRCLREGRLPGANGIVVI